ncbi:MAG: T9SS type A sorting domain-containing protein [Bacteroidota bacterium]
MRKFLLALSLFFGLQIALIGQVSVLFVDDSADLYMNAETFAANFDGIAESVTYYDCILEGASPTAMMMAEYDLVVWYAGASGIDLYFWNASDQDNPEIASYLDNGGQLWLTGNDILFDRYGSFSDPISFDQGTFVYDYLGVSSFDLETYTSDDETGLPFAIPDENSSIENLPILNWIFSTLWYVDGVSIRPEAETIYLMGDDAYVFADTVCGLAYDNGTSKVATFFFDMGLVADDMQSQSTITAMLEYFTPEPSSTVEIAEEDAFTTSPNPANRETDINIELDLEQGASGQISVWNIHGQKMTDLSPRSWLPAGAHTFTWKPQVPAGTYLVQLELEGKVSTQVIVIE